MKSSKLLRRVGTFGAYGLCIALLLLAIARGQLAERIFGSYTLCTGCFFWPSLRHDAWIMALLLLLTAATFAFRHYALQFLFAVASVALVTVCAIDVGLLDTLAQRLFWPELLRYAQEPAAAWAVWRDAFKTDHGPIVVGLTVVVLVAVVAALMPRAHAPRQAASLATIAAAMAAALLLVSTPFDYVHPESVQNVIELNRDTAAFGPYSPAFIASLNQRLQPLAEKCEGGLGLKPNVILVVVESLSAYQSKLLGGPMDFTPELDRIASDNSYFTDFVANGYTTDNGLIALLTGRVATWPAGTVRPGSVYGGYDEPYGSSVEVFGKAGYQRNFFGSFNVEFINTRTWLTRVGFDSVEGVDHPFYKDLPRFEFGAAEDRALFDRILQWLDARENGRDARADKNETLTPFFVTALTISTHPPFINPENGHASEAEVFHYADRQLARLQRELEQRGFFKNGILLITGDHRSMTPMHAEERERYGDRAFARVPLIAVGGPLPRGAIQGRFQQSDLAPSLAYLTGTQSCRNAGQGSYLRADPQPAQYTLHVRGDEHGRIDVAFDGGAGALLLAGDASRSIGATPIDWSRITDWIHADRIARSEGGETIHLHILALDGPHAREAGKANVVNDVR